MKKQGRPLTDHGELRCEITRQLVDCGATSLKSLSNSLSDEIKRSPSTLSRELKAMEWSKKRAQIIPVERNTQRTIADRRRYALQVSTLTDDKLVFIDETGFNLHTTPVYAWSPLGVTPSIYVPGNRGQNISVLAAISHNGMLDHQIVDGPFDAARMVDFLANKLFPRLRDDHVVVMDNARIHHASTVMDTFRSHQKEALFLPPYSPQLDPIEEVFSMVKNRYRALRPFPSNRIQAKEAITRIFTELNGYGFNEFYQHMRSFVTLAFSGQPFI